MPRAHQADHRRQPETQRGVGQDTPGEEMPCRVHDLGDHEVCADRAERRRNHRRGQADDGVLGEKDPRDVGPRRP